MRKKADTPEWLSDLLWDDNAGPFENILRWADRLLIFSGGGKAVVLGGLYLLGIGFHDLGKKIDEYYKLETINDIKENISDPIKAGDEMANELWPEIQKNLQKNSSPRLASIKKTAIEFSTAENVDEQKHHRKMELERQKTEREKLKTEREKLLGERQRGKQMAPMFERVEKDVELGEQAKRQEEAEGKKRERAEEDASKRREETRRQEQESEKKDKEKAKSKERERKRDMQHQKSLAKIQRGGKAAVAGGLLGGVKGKLLFGAGLGMIISKVFQLLGGKTLLTRALRSAGIVGAEALHKDDQDAPTPRERIEKGEKRKLTPAEEVVEKILSS